MNAQKMHITVIPVTTHDLDSMVSLSKLKRLAYEKVQPCFWKHAEHAEASQRQWFELLLSRDDYIALLAQQQGQTIGFIIGRIMSAPEVYNPGGLTLMIDDFCLESEGSWDSIGRYLLHELKVLAKAKGSAQILVVCGAHDERKREFLKKMNLTCASEWYVGALE